MDLLSAQQIIEDVKGKQLSPELRKEKAIELAALMLEESRRIQTPLEKKQQQLLAGMMNDPQGKAFFTSLTDQCFRSQSDARVADQMLYLIEKFGTPSFLSPLQKMALFLFRYVGRPFANITVPIVKRMLRQQMSNVILPGELKSLSQHIQKRRKDGVRINLNHLGEAILGEEEAEQRLQMYLDDLKNSEVDYISVKISTICSQLSLLGREDTLQQLEKRLKRLYRAAIQNPTILPNGQQVFKFVNLDMEEYRDLHLTVALFKRVLDDPEFHKYSAGIVLQAYLPDAFLVQQELTVWAMQRVNNDGGPIRIRLVKGANLGMEKVEASLRGWPQAPYLDKMDTDANYKRMLLYACEPERVKAVHVGVGSHNLFDVAYTLLLRSERRIEDYVGFEMLEGMADHIRRVVQSLSGNMLLYCPAATEKDFQNAVAYLMRRLDENTAPENFLRHAFDMIPGSDAWVSQTDLFSLSCEKMSEVSSVPMRDQSRFSSPLFLAEEVSFENEADTDWALPQNVKWAEIILRKWREYLPSCLPIVVGGKELFSGLSVEIKNDPSYLDKELYRYALASEEELDIALETAVNALEVWSKHSLQERLHLIDNAARQLQIHRADLIGAMVADTAKTISEADVEVSEAIDFADYYRRSIEELTLLKDLEWMAKGPVLVAPPWNFPCSIPAGGILAALASGNTVIFKPAPEAVLVGWQLVNALWEAGISKEVLQFFCCADDPIGTRLIQDPRVAAVILTGATSTAKKMMQLRPQLDLIAETGGKNALIITCMADRDLAIKDLLQSAFGHAGQKCSACSLAILEKEVFDDPYFKKQLYDAAASLKVGLPWDLSVKVNPLIRAPGPELLRGLTTLEEGETWLLEPQQDKTNANLWSPGIKWNVKPGSFTHQTELFGPVLGVMRADNLSQAIEWANATPYGLTSGIHTLDEREQKFWSEQIMAGNLYINRTITGAIVRRQPFGGCKESSFGPGAKAGGPNYVLQLMQPKVLGYPVEREPVADAVIELDRLVKQANMSDDEMESWTAAVGSYAYYWNHYFSKRHDPSQVYGQNNFFYYVPRKHLIVRVQQNEGWLDVLKAVAASLTCGTDVELSVSPEYVHADQIKTFKIPFVLKEESDEQFLNRVRNQKKIRMRFLSSLNANLQSGLADSGCHFIVAPVMENGRLELLHYLREVSLSCDYHRYGYI